MASVEEYQSQQEVSFALSDLFFFLWNKKFRLLFTSLIFTVLGGYYVTQLPKLYMATSTLLLSEDAGAMQMTSLSMFNGSSGSKLDTHIEFIKSTQFIRSIVETLELEKYAEFYPISGTEVGRPNIEHTIEVVKEDLKLSVLNNTEMLKVSFVSRTPEIAAKVVNQIGPSFFAFQSLRSREKTDRASQWLNNQVEDAGVKLALSEKALQDFIQANQSVDVTSQSRLIQSEITALMRERLVNEKALTEAKLSVNQIKTYSTEPAQLININALLSHPMVTELRKQILLQEQNLAEISKRYKSKHTKYIAVESMLNHLNKEMVILLEQLAAGIQQQYNSLKTRQHLIEQQLANAHQQNNDLAQLEIKQTRLKREVETSQKLYETLLSRLQETEVLKDLSQKDNYAVVDYAAIPQKPFKPKVALSIIVIALLSGIFSIGFWLVLHLISDRKTRFRNLLKTIDVHVLAEIPKPVKPRKNKKNDITKVISEHNYSFSEAIRALRTAVMVSSNLKQNRIIAVTSVGINDDKSNITVSLAESFCNLEKTLLVDLELRTPIIGKAFGLSDNHPGITDFIARRSKFGECLHKEPNTQLSVMPSGLVPTDPMLYLSKSRLSTLIGKLGVFYQRLIIDTPPVNTVGDALLVSKFVDGIILVCDVEKVESEQLLEAVQRLREAGAPLMGVVFNKVKGGSGRSKRTYNR